ncbi:MAG: DUF4294 domain-containing protein [Flavobacteriales bacterium]|nr:DUF4294 domain-containing protein [Flavobacteriales bacterium]MDG1766596.1 DUF4294 domain-containing protein [Flavobacteriales bacterium]
MTVRFLIFTILLALGQELIAQVQPDSTWVQATVLDGDTVPMVNIQMAIVPGNGNQKKASKSYGILKKRVVRVYPYAKAAGDIMRQLEVELGEMKNEKERKAHVKATEAELKRAFEGQLKELTVKEGIILIKLIDRETGDSSYGLIQELKGSFSAFMWQSVARIFGHDLKDDYAPYGEDWPIEQICREIELGFIDVVQLNDLK